MKVQDRRRTLWTEEERGAPMLQYVVLGTGVELEGFAERISASSRATLLAKSSGRTFLVLQRVEEHVPKKRLARPEGQLEFTVDVLKFSE